MSILERVRLILGRTDPEKTLDRAVCGNRSSDLPLDDPYPPAVCTLPPLHDGMHSDGRCKWLMVHPPAGRNPNP